MEAWKDILGKRLKIIFEDGSNHFSKKEGLLRGVTSTHLILKTDSTEEGILLNKIIRWEVKNE